MHFDFDFHPGQDLPRHAYRRLAAALAFALAFGSASAHARENLGMFEGWGAFRDGEYPRCFAIGKAIPSTLRREFQPYADIATWPRRSVRSQVHFRLSRNVMTGRKIVLSIGSQRFELTGGGADAWAVDKRMDAAIVAAMRSATSMTVSARGADGRGFSNTWPLAGAATAMDASTIGCAAAR